MGNAVRWNGRFICEAPSFLEKLDHRRCQESHTNSEQRLSKVLIGFTLYHDAYLFMMFFASIGWLYPGSIAFPNNVERFEPIEANRGAINCVSDAVKSVSSSEHLPAHPLLDLSSAPQAPLLPYLRL
jgi:hypothetical protein